MAQNEPLLAEPRAAERVGVCAHTLKRWRLRGIGPKFLKLGGRTIKYRESDIEQFLAESVVDPRANAISRNRARRKQRAPLHARTRTAA